MKKSVLIIFDGKFNGNTAKWRGCFDVLIAPENFKSIAENNGLAFYDIEDFVGSESIYEASAFAEELSRLKLQDGSRLAKSFLYQGYELWWIHYDNLFLYFCLPYTQYRKLLEFLKDFENICLYEPPFENLFSCYLKSYGCNLSVIKKQRLKILQILPFGVLLQICLTIFFVPILMIQKKSIMVFTGDKLEKDKDYDFRMKFIYGELRQRKLSFVEFIRGLESWKIVLKHAVIRKRPVIYSEAVTFVGRFLSFITGGHRRARKKFKVNIFVSEKNPQKRFKLLVASQYLLGVYDDIWAIRIMKLILRITCVRAGFIPAATERNFHAVLGCKLNNIPIIGILHGVASRHYNVYDFMPGFNGERMLSVDKYGLWSEWWKEYYIKNSKAYHPEQLCVSGPMRPLEEKENAFKPASSSGFEKRDDPIKVLFVPGQLSEPKEVIPYLLALMEVRHISVYLTFRHYRDTFEGRLKEIGPDIIEKIGTKKILRGDINEAISQCDIIVGSNSTAVLEALLQLKPIVLFDTHKWGDYFNLKEYGVNQSFFASNPKELIKKIQLAKNVSPDEIIELRKRFFGDPCKNGSAWVIDEIEKILKKSF